MSKLVLSLILTITGVFSAAAQEEFKVPPFPGQSTTSAKTEKRELTATEQLGKKLDAARRKPEYATLLAELVNKFPYDSQTERYIYLQSATKNLSSEETKNLIAKLLAATEQSPATLRGFLLSESSEVLDSKNLPLDAIDSSQKAIELLSEADYIEYRKKRYDLVAAEQIKKKPDYKPNPFNENRIKKELQEKKASVYNVLGKNLWATGKFEAAEKAYRESFAANESKEAALGITRVAERNGNVDEALKYGTFAALTGTLLPQEMDYFHSVYAKKNGGKADGVEKYLDAEYLKTYRNPVKGEKYKRSDKRSERTVLAEFFTGAACKPCVAFDSAFDVIRKDYSNKELSLLVYHADIPVTDPLSNYSEKSREKYYEINFAPRVFIDGNHFKGDAPRFNSDEERMQGIYNALAKDINANLETPAEAEIKLKAKRSGQKVKTIVAADKLKTSSDDITLQIALVENETTYSGENGYRFHIMVVRALAGNHDKRIFGYKVDPSKANKFEYTFDVNDIIARNHAYYDTSVAERSEEYKKKYAGVENPPIQPDYKYKRSHIDSKHLSVVAFLQDNKTKKILQSVTVSLAK